MGKPKRRVIGFSSSKPVEVLKQQVAKEQQAIALINQGKLQEAEAIYRELIAAETKNHIVYCNLAVICGMQGKSEELILLLKKTLQIKPDYTEAQINLGVALKEQGDLTGAIASYKAALKLNSDYPEAHYNLGNALQQKGDIDAAITSYNTALKLKPSYPEAHYNLGNALQQKGDIDAAITSYNTALQLKPNYPAAHVNLGSTLRKQGNLAAAIASYRSAVQIKFDQPEAHNNLGNVLLQKGDIDAAITSYETALQLKPSYPEAHYNLGNALLQKGDIDAAITSYNTALQLKPDYQDAEINLSMAELQVGDYKRGWQRYECRFDCKKDKEVLDAQPSCIQWNVEDCINGSRILLVSEQGLGDTLQFMRYAIALRSLEASVSLCAPTELHSLIQISGIDPSPLSPEQANRFTEGQWIPLLSVPRYLEVSPSNPIITDPYIKTSVELVAKWADILSKEQKPIIGINWQGNPDHEKTTSIGRSLPLETFAPIATKTNALLLSLQKGFGSEQLQTCSFRHRFVSCQEQVNETWDFLETAAIIANCDLIITSDTAMAHLAGGMGKTNWLLLKKVPEWRWGLDGDTTFWYPSMHLFRQKERGNWDEVMEQVTNKLINEDIVG